jgi:hypothetical protein
MMHLAILLLSPLLSLPIAPMDTSAKDESKLLVDELLPFAQKLLSEHGEFFPFGATINVDGVIGLAGAATGDDHPPSSELISILRGAFAKKAKAGEVRAVAIAYDVLVQHPNASEKTDAVAIDIEHRDSYCVTVFFPYSLRGTEVTFGETFTIQGACHAFGGGS